MPYSAETSRLNPSCFIFVIDQSGSMTAPFRGQSGQGKAVKVADAVNRLLFELTIRCTRDQTEGVRNYYDVGVIAYGPSVGPALSGRLSGQSLVPIRDVADNPARMEERRRKVEDGAGGLVEERVRFPVWFDPVAQNNTPMCQALRLVRSVLEPWVQSHPNSFPPIVINITDGEATDGDPRPCADAIRGLATNDGDVLLFNLHISSHGAAPVAYPECESGLPDDYARQLFQMSSVLPPHIREALMGEGFQVGPQARGFVFNAEIVEVVKFLDIGTRPKALG